VPLPRRLKIGPATYPVTRPQRIPVGDDSHAAGNWDYETGELRIARDRNPHFGERLDTLLHEALHVIDDQLALGLSERQVHRLAHGLATFLVDNPRFVRWLQDHD
jgi:hypothetical protein